MSDKPNQACSNPYGYPEPLPSDYLLRSEVVAALFDLLCIDEDKRYNDIINSAIGVVENLRPWNQKPRVEPMTTELPIVTRLRGVTTTRNGRGLDSSSSQHHLTNPDGPEAADLITELVDALEGAVSFMIGDISGKSQREGIVKQACAALVKATTHER